MKAIVVVKFGEYIIDDIVDYIMWNEHVQKDVTETKGVFELVDGEYVELNEDDSSTVGVELIQTLIKSDMTAISGLANPDTDGSVYISVLKGDGTKILGGMLPLDKPLTGNMEEDNKVVAEMVRGYMGDVNVLIGLAKEKKKVSLPPADGTLCICGIVDVTQNRCTHVTIGEFKMVNDECVCNWLYMPDVDEFIEDEVMIVSAASMVSGENEQLAKNGIDSSLDIYPNASMDNLNLVFSVKGLADGDRFSAVCNPTERPTTNVGLVEIVQDSISLILKTCNERKENNY